MHKGGESRDLAETMVRGDDVMLFTIVPDRKLLHALHPRAFSMDSQVMAPIPTTSVAPRVIVGLNPAHAPMPYPTPSDTLGLMVPYMGMTPYSVSVSVGSIVKLRSSAPLRPEKSGVGADTSGEGNCEMSCGVEPYLTWLYAAPKYTVLLKSVEYKKEPAMLAVAVSTALTPREPVIESGTGPMRTLIDQMVVLGNRVIVFVVDMENGPLSASVARMSAEPTR